MPLRASLAEDEIWRVVWGEPREALPSAAELRAIVQEYLEIGSERTSRQREPGNSPGGGRGGATRRAPPQRVARKTTP